MSDQLSNSPESGNPENDATAQSSGDLELTRLATAIAQLAKSPDILDSVVQAVREIGVAGEDRLIRLLYLIGTSRLLSKPASAVVKGHSGGGKSFLVKSVLKLFPPRAYWLRSGLSPKLIVRTAESFSHRILVIEENASLNTDAETFIRLLLSEGRLVYSTLEPVGKNWEEVTLIKEGPAGLLLTTTNLKVHAENETRMLSLSVDDGRAQTKNALLAAARARGKVVDTTVHQLFQEWLVSQPTEVHVPFLECLAKEFAPAAVRIRRDFNLVVSLVEAHALLHQMTRKRDENGRVIATLADYAAVYDLVADLISDGVDASAPSDVRETVQAVETLLPQHPQGVPLKAVTEVLGLDKSNVSRRVAKAVEGGYLVDIEEKKGKALRLQLGEPLPNGEEVMPHPDRIADCAVAPNSMNGELKRTGE